ncbi:hypothetical protein [Burkholderia sp. JKS000303]|uniref:hypothetical protein n=1 Tax=Burkholderia sp. JKS000303 TaxID=1938747 RepID=UPI000BF46B7D|nr:hypothetical protein [Burkholderia sp. JKS000303]PFH12874.1 hypothetical protein BX604_7294 [Burkholderia sp. JKS000303]
MSLRNSVLLYRPSLSIWTAKRLDKAQSQKVTQDAGATDGSARVHKDLLPDCTELDDVQKWANSYRTFIYTNTAPWDDSGWRVGNVARHMDFIAESGDRITQGYLLVDALLVKYQQAVAEAQFRLAHLFNPSDYPGEQEVRAKFRFSLDVMPLPTADDFRIVEGVDQSEVDRLIGEATSATEQRIADAMAEAYKRLHGVVSKMASTLECYGDKTVKKFNDSLVGNIAELVAVMPALNLTNDPKLAQLCDEARSLATYSPVDLRKDEAVRAAAITEARALADKFRDMVEQEEKTTVTRAKSDAALVADLMEV